MSRTSGADRYVLWWAGYEPTTIEYRGLAEARKAMVQELKLDVAAARRAGWQHPHYDRTSENTGEVRAGVDKQCPLWSRCSIHKTS